MERPSKDFILYEVRRCAASNDGVPVGKKRFQDLTGIRESDWLGRYWTRWNDALVEAGFQPNAMQDTIHDRETLIRHLALLTIDLGRFPTVAELRMRARTEPSFPSHTRFSLRLGNREQQVAEVVSLAKQDSSLVAVLDLLEAAPDEAPAPGQRPRGFVYMIKSGKHHKIGHSNDLGRRSYEIALQLPEKATLVHAVETDDPTGIEAYWHRRFADRRANGEWFLLTKDDVAAFKARRRFM